MRLQNRRCGSYDDIFGDNSAACQTDISVCWASLFYGPWMDFILPTLILRSEEKMTLAIGIFSWISSNSAENFTLFAAGSLLVAVPITLLFVATQKHITTGLVSGAVKE